MDPGLTVERPRPEAAEVEGDPSLLLLVLQNLATNAVRHNDAGGWMRWELERAGDRVALRVANSADAIPPEVQERVFDRFLRVDAARAAKGSGLGLGLSLAREIARAHGGDLELISSDPDGTVFELRLPCHPDQPPIRG